MSVARMSAEHAETAAISGDRSAAPTQTASMGEERQGALPHFSRASAEHAQIARIATGQSTSAPTDKRWGGMGEERQDAPPHFNQSSPAAVVPT